MKTVEKIRTTDVALQAPPAKAHTLRALVISSLAAGQSRIVNPLFGKDQINLIESLRRLGVAVERGKDHLAVEGCGGRYSPTAEELNVGESGVSMNVLTAAANLADRPIVLTGAKRITERPISEVVAGLRQLGCEIEYLAEEGFPPIRIAGGGIPGGTAEIHGATTSQYFSSITISSPLAREPVTLRCLDHMTERPYFEITLQMMERFGATAAHDAYREITIPTGGYEGREIRIEGDYSSASFFFLAAAICGSSVSVTNLAHDTKQGDRGFLGLVEQMGCAVEEIDDGYRVEGCDLEPIEREMSDLPDLVPPLAIACAFAQGTSRLTNIGHLRHKECDRLAVMVEQLGRMDVAASCDEGALVIEGNPNCHGATIDPHNDHRIAMSFATAGLVTGGQSIEQETCVAKSFPDFWERFEAFHA